MAFVRSLRSFRSCLNSSLFPPKYSYKYSSTLETAQLFAPEDGRTTFSGYYGTDSDSYMVNDILISNESIVATPNFFSYWKPKIVKEITLDSLLMLKIVYPKPDIVIIGTGAQSKSLSSEFNLFFKSNKIQYEVMDSVC